jgi:hypothetical protein
MYYTIAYVCCIYIGCTQSRFTTKYIDAHADSWGEMCIYSWVIVALHIVFQNICDTPDTVPLKYSANEQPPIVIIRTLVDFHFISCYLLLTVEIENRNCYLSCVKCQ